MSWKSLFRLGVLGAGIAFWKGRQAARRPLIAEYTLEVNPAGWRGPVPPASPENPEPMFLAPSGDSPARRVSEQPIDPRVGTRELTVLHLSDLHLYPGQEWLVNWVNELAALPFDFVALTGDNLGDAAGLGLVKRALAPLKGRPGAFVFGSNDYYAPRRRNPFSYLQRSWGLREHSASEYSSFVGEVEAAGAAGVSGAAGAAGASGAAKKQRARLDAEGLREFLRGEMGWTDLNNATAQVQVNGHLLSLAGLDDPHIDRARAIDLREWGVSWVEDSGKVWTVPGLASPRVEEDLGPAFLDEDEPDWPNLRPRDDFGASGLRLGLVHSPYRQWLDTLTWSGADLILAGHTHGGQVCLPGGLALTSNCDLPPGNAAGLFENDLGRPQGARPAAAYGRLARLVQGRLDYLDEREGEAAVDIARRDPTELTSLVYVSAGLGTSRFAPVRVACPPRAGLLHVRF